MKKLLIVLSLALILCVTLSVSVFAEGEKAPATGTCAGCEICNPKPETNIDDMKEMEFDINGGAFVDSLEFLGKGMLGIFVVTLVIIGAVALLNWHGRSLERRNQNKKD